MKNGRPTKYKEEYDQELIDYFDIEPYREVPKTITTPKGNVIEDLSLVPNRLPTFERFAQNIGVHVDTMIEWCSVHPSFSEAYLQAKQMQKDFLIANGLSGLFNASFTKFVAINITDMKDRTETDITTKGEALNTLPDPERAAAYADYLKHRS